MTFAFSYTIPDTLHYYQPVNGGFDEALSRLEQFATDHRKVLSYGEILDTEGNFKVAARYKIIIDNGKTVLKKLRKS